MITLKNLTKTVIRDESHVDALKDINIQFGDTGLVAIKGGTKSGKTCLLRVLCHVDTQTEGNVFVDGVDLGLLADKEIQNYRTHYVGMVTEEEDVLPNLTVAENISLGTAFGRIKPAKETLEILYDSLNLTKVVNVPVSKCTKEEKALTSIGRLLVKSPKVLLIDDIDKSIAPDMAIKVWRLLKEVSETHLVIVVSDNSPCISKFADRVIAMENGRIVSDAGSDNKNQQNVLEQGMIDKTLLIKKHRFTLTAMFKATKQILFDYYKPILKSMVLALLLVIGFVLSSTLCAFKTTQTVAKSSVEHGDDYIEFYKKDGDTKKGLEYDPTSSTSVISQLQALKFAYMCAKHEVNWATNVNGVGFTVTSLISNSEAIKKGDINKFDQEILAGVYTGSGGVPNDTTYGQNVVISDYLAEVIIKYGLEYGFAAGQNLNGNLRNLTLYNKLVSDSEQISNNFVMNGMSYKIVGIYKTDFDKYVDKDLKVKNGMGDIFNYNLQHFYSVIHVNTNFYTLNARRPSSIEISSDQFLVYNSLAKDTNYEKLTGLSNKIDVLNSAKYSGVKVSGSGFISSKNPSNIYVSADIFLKMISYYDKDGTWDTVDKVINALNSGTNIDTMLGGNNDNKKIKLKNYSEKETLTIVGVISDKNVTNSVVIYGKPEADEDFDTRSKFEYLYLKTFINTNTVIMPVKVFNISEIEHVIDVMTNKDNGYTVDTLAMSSISQVGDVINAWKFAFIIFAVLMVALFVFYEYKLFKKIYYKNTRTIGLLRSYGCTKFNVSFTIAFIMVVAMFASLILGTFITWLMTLVGNSLMMTNYVYAVSIFSINMWLVLAFALIILGGAVLISPYVCDELQMLEPIYIINYEKLLAKKKKAKKQKINKEKVSEPKLEKVEVQEEKVEIEKSNNENADSLYSKDSNSEETVNVNPETDNKTE